MDSVVVAHGLGCPAAKLLVPGLLVPGPRIELMSTALAGRFLITGPLKPFLKRSFLTLY